MQEYLVCLIKHFTLIEGALFIYPARHLLIQPVVERFRRLILVIVDDLGLFGFGDNYFPIGIRGLHCGGLDHNVIGGILEVGEDHAEV